MSENKFDLDIPSLHFSRLMKRNFSYGLKMTALKEIWVEFPCDVSQQEK